jgi:hypothetical protein
VNDRAPLAGLVRALADIDSFSRVIPGRPLRPYQLDVARAVLRSIDEQAGRTITVMMPRQSGKNETSAHLEAFLLTRHQRLGGTIVKAAPTFKPQTINSILRLSTLLNNALTCGRWKTEHGYILRLGEARCMFFSAQPGANVVGGTASLLLECDEAQDVDPAKWSKDFLPMGATGNATRVYWGTPWTDDDLLATSIAEAKAAQASDGIRRHFEISADEVTRANPLYGRHVAAKIARLGEHHPIVQIQYLLKTLAHAGRLLSADQLAALEGIHQPEAEPKDGAVYVAAIDVAGADEEDPEGVLTRVNPKRDSTVLMLARVEEPRIAVPEGGAVVEPVLRVARIHAWTGTPHRQLYPTVLDLVRSVWRCRSVVVDATGVGGGLAAFLAAALGPRIVTPYLYTAQTKSALAYGLLEALNGGRLSVYAESADAEANAARRELLHQAAATYELRANQVMSFSVPEARGHDDHLNALALLPQAAKLGALRQATSASSGPTLSSPSGTTAPLDADEG